MELCIYSETASYREETVVSVTFTAEDGVAGDFSFDLASVDRSDASTLDNTVYYNGVVPANNVAFSLNLSSLQSSTTYCYRAVIQVVTRMYMAM